MKPFRLCWIDDERRTWADFDRLEDAHEAGRVARQNGARLVEIMATTPRPGRVWLWEVDGGGKLGALELATRKTMRPGALTILPDAPPRGPRGAHGYAMVDGKPGEVYCLDCAATQFGGEGGDDRLVPVSIDEPVECLHCGGQVA